MLTISAVLAPEITQENPSFNPTRTLQTRQLDSLSSQNAGLLIFELYKLAHDAQNLQAQLKRKIAATDSIHGYVCVQTENGSKYLFDCTTNGMHEDQGQLKTLKHNKGLIIIAGNSNEGTAPKPEDLNHFVKACLQLVLNASVDHRGRHLYQEESLCNLTLVDHADFIRKSISFGRLSQVDLGALTNTVLGEFGTMTQTMLTRRQTTTSASALGRHGLMAAAQSSDPGDHAAYQTMSGAEMQAFLDRMRSQRR